MLFSLTMGICICLPAFLLAVFFSGVFALDQGECYYPFGKLKSMYAKIPVRFRFLTFPISGWIDKELFLGKAKGQLSCHPYLEVYLAGKWIACDATVDPTLKEPFIYNEWDGEKSVKIQLPGVDCVDADFISPHLPLEGIKELIARYKKAFPLPLRPFAFKIGEWMISRNMNKFRRP